MAKNAPVKKSKRRLKRSVRRSLAAVLMITAIGVAAVPVPENYALPEDEPMAAAEIDAYEEVYKAIGNKETAEEGKTIYSLDIYNGGLYWQYKIDSTNYKVIEYNNAYPDTSLTLSNSVPTNYTYIKLSTFQEWVKKTNYTLTADGYNTAVDERAFFEEYFANDQEYKDFIANRTKDPGERIESITRGVVDLSDVDQRIYYCNTNYVGEKSLRGYILVPITNHITDAAVLAQIGKTSVGAIADGDLVYIPQYINTNGVTSGDKAMQDDEGYLLASAGEKITSTQTIQAIGNYAFAGNGVLFNIELPDWLQDIGEGAFMDCSYLQSVSIPFLKKVPDAAFKNCASLRTVNWWQDGKSSGLQTIGVEAFYGTSVAESIAGQGTLRFPIGIREIMDAAFYGCGALQRIEFESPNAGTAAKIDKYAFFDNSALASVTFNNKVVTELQDYCFAMGVYSNAMTEFTFPDSGFTTGKKILANRTSLTQITVPGNVTNLAGDILDGCTGLLVATFSGASTTYEPELFSSVETDDFYVTGPAMMTNASKDDVTKASQPRRSTWDAEKVAAGYNIPYLYKIGNKEYYEVCSGEGYLESIDKSTGTLTSCDLKDPDRPVPNGELVIPDKVGNTDVVKIASDCFKGKDRLTNSVTSLVVGNNIRTIENSVFKSWNNLEEVEIGKSVQTIGKEAFADCPYLRNITFATPDSYQTLQSIGTDAFATRSGRLTIHGDIVDGYAPFEYAMDPGHYVENSVAAGAATKSRILYQSRWDSPSSKHMSVLYGEYNDGNGYATLVDYPLYQDFFTSDGEAGLSKDLEEHNRDMEKQFYNAYGNYAYPTEEDTYLELKVRFAHAYRQNGSSAYDGPYYGPWINPSFCARYEEWLAQKWLDKYDLTLAGSNTVLDWFFEPMTVQAATMPDAYFAHAGNEYNFLANYLKHNGDRSQITVDYIDGWSIDEQDMIEAAVKIVVPAGVESIDIKAFYDADKPSQQNVASNQDNYITYFGENSGNSRKGIFVYGVNSGNAGLFSGNIDDRYTSSVSDNQLDPDIDQGDHRKGNDRIKVVDMSQSNVVNIPDYAFEDCELLEEVSIPASCEVTGKLPFKDCVKLKNLSSSSEDVPALNGILYQKKEDASYELVECILAKGVDAGSGMISSDTDDPYISQVSSIGESAFENCSGITKVDLLSIDNGASSNKLKAIPNYCFKNCDALTEVVLPQSTQDVGQEAFANIREDYYYIKGVEGPRLVITIYGTEFNFATTAFDPKGDGTPGNMESTIDMVTVWTYENTAAERYVLEQQKKGYDIWLGNQGKNHVNPPQYLGTIKRVNFWDWNGDALCDTIYLDPDNNRIFEDEVPVEVVAIVTAANHRPGYRFSGWRGDGGLTLGDPIPGDSITYIAQYESDGTMVNGKYIVEFFDGIDGRQLSGRYAAEDGKYYIEAGTSFMSNGWPVPEPVGHVGYTFLAWSNGWTENTVIDSTMRVIALYSADNTGGGTTNTSGSTTNTSNGSGNTGGGSNSSSKKSSSTSATSTSSSSDSTSSTSSGSNSTGVKYTVTVENGSGSGSYEVGSTVIIAANEPAPGMVFQKWTTESDNVTLASVSMTATTFTMPANNVTVTANYVASTGNVSNSGSGNGNNTGSGSTRVDITKPGISNKDLATANVNGSTDNFIVKITETDEATRAVADALTNKYGSLDNILYYAMDISLYDSTGTVKISDTTGITVDITIPIPDALVAYGGNNMAGAVINGNQLENLNENFTTINGVPCIRFTATHFSPYTVYVDTGNLTEGMLDTTPKTGDPIHPKWFLSIGLACLSVILFMKKDKAVKVKTA